MYIDYEDFMSILNDHFINKCCFNIILTKMRSSNISHMLRLFVDIDTIHRCLLTASSLD